MEIKFFIFRIDPHYLQVIGSAIVGQDAILSYIYALLAFLNLCQNGL